MGAIIEARLLERPISTKEVKPNTVFEIPTAHKQGKDETLALVVRNNRRVSWVKQYKGLRSEILDNRPVPHFPAYVTVSGLQIFDHWIYRKVLAVFG